MAQSGNSSSLLTLGLLAAGAGLVYELFFSTPAVATTSTPSISSVVPPAAGAAIPPASTVASPASTASASAPAAGGPTLDSLYEAMLALITTDADPNFTGSADSLTSSAYHFNVYLQLVAPTYTVPDPSVVFGGETNASANMTAASYWALMGPAMRQANVGLSGGLGCYAGAGAFLRGMGAYRW
jgi:hypothetical protein